MPEDPDNQLDGEIEVRIIAAILDGAACMTDSGAVTAVSAADLGQANSAHDVGEIHRDLSCVSHLGQAPRGREESRDFNRVNLRDDGLDQADQAIRRTLAAGVVRALRPCCDRVL